MIRIGKNKKVLTILETISSDINISITDTALLHALINYYMRAKHADCFQVTRSGLMKISKISSTRTYHKCIKNLIQLGFINYTPSYHPTNGSKVSWRIKGI